MDRFRAFYNEMISKNANRLPKSIIKSSFRDPLISRNNNLIDNNNESEGYSKIWDLNDSETSKSNTILQMPSSGPMTINGTTLISVNELPLKYRCVFETFPYFNVVQSTVFNDVFNSDKPLVVCAPTGSGKTVIFELAIVRLMIKHESQLNNSKIAFKIVYIAPLKVLCSERCRDWNFKFGRLGLKCSELTGDSEIDNYDDLRTVSIILTTPEKWDSISRNWKQNKSFIKTIQLILIDEVHLINDGSRGATMEAVISRMKTVRAARLNDNDVTILRFIAVSATAPNVEDIASWLRSDNEPGVSHKMAEHLRPVKLDHYVFSYQCADSWTDFRFDISLSYKLDSVIKRYSNQKPTLVFCSTRKSTELTASTLCKAANYFFNQNQRKDLIRIANTIKIGKLRDALFHGIGYHHAGLDTSERSIIEGAFGSGILPVLISTSTLAMGVNLPAHLVIIKNTTHYSGGCCTEYDESSILQMIGRAGRPQYDTSATSIIMTKEKNKQKYENLLNGTQILESNLHKHLAEHLNVEIVLETITDIAIAMDWIRSTFFYIRMLKNPKYYGVHASNSKDRIDHEIEELCKRELNGLHKYGMIKMDDDCCGVQSTPLGMLMAKYCISLNTMKKFLDIKGNESIGDLITVIASCEELIHDVQLRVNERKTLNTLNKSSDSQTIRFPIKGKIKNANMKVNVLIQVAFDCIQIPDSSMNQDVSKILRAGQRLSKCLAEVMILHATNYGILLNAIILSKCFRSRLWHDSKYVTRQLNKIGPALSSAFVEKGVINFNSILRMNPREIEMYLNRNPPFGTQLQDEVRHLPKYSLTLEQIDDDKLQLTKASIKITIEIVNFQEFQKQRTTPFYHCGYLIVGNDDDKIICNQRISDTVLVNSAGIWTRTAEVEAASNSDYVYGHFISEFMSGIDVECKLRLKFAKSTNSALSQLNNRNTSSQFLKSKECGHKCAFKGKCRHNCCKSDNNKSQTQTEYMSVKEVFKSKAKIPPQETCFNAKRLKSTPSDSSSVSSVIKKPIQTNITKWLIKGNKNKNDNDNEINAEMSDISNGKSQTFHNDNDNDKYGQISEDEENHVKVNDKEEFMFEDSDDDLIFNDELMFKIDDEHKRNFIDDNLQDDHKILLKSQDSVIHHNANYEFDDIDDNELLSMIPNEDFQDNDNTLHIDNLNKPLLFSVKKEKYDVSYDVSEDNAFDYNSMQQWSQFLPKQEFYSSYFTPE